MTGKLFYEVLDKRREGIFKRLNLVFGSGCYLAGGTALALQIGHRQSFDFDVFQNKEITFAAKRKITKEFQDLSPQTLVDAADELTFVAKGEIKITLLNYYWGPRLPLVRPSGVIPLLSIKEIAATKAYALGRRGNYRDYFDLYAILKNGHSTLKDIIKLSREKYGEVFSERMFLEQLTCLDDIGPDHQLVFLKEKYVSPRALTRFFAELIHELV